MSGGAIAIGSRRRTLRLDHNLERLSEDHVNAKAIAEEVAQSPRVILDPGTVRTNIVVFRLTEDAPDALTVVGRARDRGVLVFAFGSRTVRAVTHLDVSAEACARAGRLLLEAIDAPS
jgi:threonine aldolase